MLAMIPSLVALTFFLAKNNRSNKESADSAFPKKRTISLADIFLIVVMVWEAIAFGFDLKLFLMVETGYLVLPIIARRPITQTLLIVFTVLRTIKIILFGSLSPITSPSKSSSTTIDKDAKDDRQDITTDEGLSIVTIITIDPSAVDQDSNKIENYNDIRKEITTAITAVSEIKHGLAESKVYVTPHQEEPPTFENDTDSLINKNIENSVDQHETYDASLNEHQTSLSTMITSNNTIDQTTTTTTDGNIINDNTMHGNKKSLVIIKAIVTATVFIQLPLTLLQYFYVEKYNSSPSLTTTFITKSFLEIVAMAITFFYMIMDYEAKRMEYKIIPDRLSSFLNHVLFLYVAIIFCYSIRLPTSSNRFEKECLQVDVKTGALVPTPFHNLCLTSQEKTVLISSLCVFVVFIIFKCISKLVATMNNYISKGSSTQTLEYTKLS